MGYTCFDDDICCCLGFIFSNSAFPLFLLPLILYLFWSRGTWKQTQWKIGKWTPIYNDFMTSGVSYADNIVKSHRHTTWTPYTYLYTCTSSPASGRHWCQDWPGDYNKKETNYSIIFTTSNNKKEQSHCCFPVGLLSHHILPPAIFSRIYNLWCLLLGELEHPLCIPTKHWTKLSVNACMLYV